MQLFLRILALAGFVLAITLGIISGTWKYAIATAALSILLFIVTLKKPENPSRKVTKMSKGTDNANATSIAGASITAHNLSNDSSCSSSSFDSGGGADGGC